MSVIGYSSGIRPHAVVGIEINGEACAFVLDSLRQPERHIVNLTFDRTALSVTYCDLVDCVREGFVSVPFAEPPREIDLEELGLLHDGTKLIRLGDVASIRHGMALWFGKRQTGETTMELRKYPRIPYSQLGELEIASGGGSVRLDVFVETISCQGAGVSGAREDLAGVQPGTRVSLSFYVDELPMTIPARAAL